MKRSHIDEGDFGMLPSYKRLREQSYELGSKRGFQADPSFDFEQSRKQARRVGVLMSDPLKTFSDEFELVSGSKPAISTENSVEYEYCGALKDLLGRDEKFIIDTTVPDPKSQQLIVYVPPPGYPLVSPSNNLVQEDSEFENKMDIA